MAARRYHQDIKWIAGALALIGAALAILSWVMDRDLNQKKTEWNESWSHTDKLNRVITEEKILKEGTCQVEFTVPNDIHWQRVTRRMRNPRFFIFGRQLERDPFKRVPVELLESIPASIKVNGSKESWTVALAYVQVDERPGTAPRWGLEVPVELGDRIEVTLTARPGRVPLHGDLNLMMYFRADKDHNVYFDWALTELLIRIVRWTGIGLIVVTAVMLFLVMRKSTPAKA